MPRVSEFFGVVIAMYFSDHNPPHFHAEYAGDEAEFSINTLEILEGQLPRRTRALVVEWASLHRRELLANWERARQQVPLEQIDPLDCGRGVMAMRRQTRISAVTPLDRFRVRLELTDTTTKEVDLEPYLWGPVFEPIRNDPTLFRAVKVDPRLGTIVWDNGADLDPDVLCQGLTPAWRETEKAAG